ncbi:MAG: hypothetical protein Q9174_007279, partial [Haloplaca sp. 1 TL-2023]
PHLSVFRFSSSLSTTRNPSRNPPAYTTDDAVAGRNTTHAKVLRWLRIALSIITFLLAIIIISFSGNVLRTYSNNRNNEVEWILPLWPATVDLRPTHALLGGATVLAVFSILNLVAILAPTPLRAPKPLNILSTILAFLSLTTTIVITAFASTITNNLADETNAATLESWTCKWQGLSRVAPGKFSDICTQSTSALNLMILMIVIEVFCVLLAGWGWWVGGRVRKEEEAREMKTGIRV